MVLCDDVALALLLVGGVALLGVDGVVGGLAHGAVTVGRARSAQGPAQEGQGDGEEKDALKNKDGLVTIYISLLIYSSTARYQTESFVTEIHRV